MIIEAIDASLDLLLNKHGKIAFWGINDYFSDLSMHLKEASNSNIYYVDISEMKQGNKLNGKIICSPQIIQEEDIKVVVVQIVSLVTTIEQKIKNDFRGVTRIINILDLIKNVQ